MATYCSITNDVNGYTESLSEQLKSFELRCQSETKRGTFVFPPPPRLCRSANNSSCCGSSDSDNSNVCQDATKNKKQTKIKPKRLPPIGVFWDIENCQVPKGRSAAAVTHMIRDLFYEGYREAGFLVVCDVKKERSQVVQDLNDSQVSLIHVSATSKNAADEKLRQELRRFADTHPPPAAAVLISGDVNFAPDLYDLRYRKKLYVILVHNTNAADALILSANETHSYAELTEALPKEIKPQTPNTNQQVELIIMNLPLGFDVKVIKNRLKQLSDNCGGRVVNFSSENGIATIRFTSMDSAMRAQRRMDGEDVFGNKIYTAEPSMARNSPSKNFTARKIKSNSEESTQNNSFQYIATTGAYGPLDLTRINSSVSYNQPSAYNLQVIASNMETRQFDSVTESHQTYCVQMENQNSTIKMEGRKIKGNSQMLENAASQMNTPANAALNTGIQYSKNISGYSISADETFFQPVPFTANRNGLSQNSNATSPIDLNITNIDSSLDSHEIRNLLANMFKEHVAVHNVKINQHSDGSINAVVRVSSITDAQYAISMLHHHMLGNKRISISHAQANNQVDPQLLRTEIVFLLQEVPGNSMPLFKFLTLLEKRVGCSVSVSEVNKLRDVCKIIEESRGRNVLLNPELRGASPNSANVGYVRDFSFCSIHCPNGVIGRGWAEQDIPPLPNVNASLQDFSTKLKIMIESHFGILPLQTFSECYQAQFHELIFNDEEHGVPLEHFVTRVKDIELKIAGNNSTKYIVWMTNNADNNPNPDDNISVVSSSKCNSPPTVGSLSLLCRELVDLLRKAPRCQLPFSKFIPAYHHHFGRQCRVADYGYTKLIELFEAVPDVVQLMGDCQKKVITLSKQAQIRRFTSDLLRILKIQPFKQITGADFPKIYEKQIGRPFNPMEYGLCYLEDLISEVNKFTVVVTVSEDAKDFMVAIPKREQTADEKRKTKTFQCEVVELLRHAPNCSIEFNKFVPAYHHHFGHQCKVSDYGFTKLIDLFEVIPQTVQIKVAPNNGEQERLVSLIQPLMLKVLKEQITKLLVKESHMLSVSLNVLPRMFLKEYGYALKPQIYECENLMEVLSKLDGLEVEMASVGPIVVLVDSDAKLKMELRVWSCLVTPPHSKTLAKFGVDYRVKFGRSCGVDRLRQMANVVQIHESDTEETTITLTPFYILAARIYRFMYEAGGSVNLSNFEFLYSRRCGIELRPYDYGVNTILELLQKLVFLVVLKGRRKKTVMLNKNLIDLDIQLPVGIANRNDSNSGAPNNSESTVQWPPPPPHRAVTNNGWNFAPPKPDTPPAYGNSSWGNNLWNSPVSSLNDNVNITIPMPSLQTSNMYQHSGEMSGLVSPERNLLPAHSFPNMPNNGVPFIKTPKPSELPKPSSDLLIGLDTSEDQSTVIDSESAIDKNKRKMRLAPQFNVQMS